MGLPRTSLVKKPETTLPSPVPPVQMPVSTLTTDLSRATDPSIDVDVASVAVNVAPPAPAPRAMMPSVVEPSTQALLERAAALGPVRLTWESIALPDPVLEKKSEPRVAERRARLTRIVKATLGVCVGVCVLAIGVSIFSGGEAQAASSASVAKTMPSEVVHTPVALAGAIRGKASAHEAPKSAPVAMARPAWAPARPIKRR